MKKIDSTPTIPETVPKSFSEAIHILFHQLAECARLYNNDSPKNHETVQDMLLRIGWYIDKIEQKFWQKLTTEERWIFHTMKTVISEKLIKIVEGKPVLWWDWESILHICLDIGNRIDQTPSMSEITDKIQGRVVQNSSGPYII